MVKESHTRVRLRLARRSGVHVCRDTDINIIHSNLDRLSDSLALVIIILLDQVFSF